MVSYVKGAELYAKMSELKEKALNNIHEAKEVLEPKLSAQGLTITEGDSYSTVVSDIKSMVTIEKNIINGTLDRMNFVESGLFSMNILPSNVVLLSKSRVIFVEKGLLYIMEYDTISLTITYKKIYKIDPLWNVSNNSIVRIVKGYNNQNVFIYPEFGNTIISIYGDGLLSSGNIYFNTINIGDLNHIIDLSINSADVAFITEDRHYCRIYTFDTGIDYTLSYPFGDIIDVPLPFMGTTLCEGDINLIGTETGAVFTYNPNTKEFTYFNDIMNNPSYDEHIIARRNNPENYSQILDLAKNHGRVIAATASNKLYLTYSRSKYELDILLKDKFVALDLEDSFILASLAINTSNADAICYLCGLNNNLEAVAYKFTNEDEYPVKMILGNSSGKCQYVTIGAIDAGSVLIQVYENTYKASDYYTEEEIQENGYKDYHYDLIGMSFSTYEDGIYIDYPEFNPLFVPDKIVSERDTTVVIGANGSSKLFNFAITNDHKHWAVVNIDDSIAINVQDIASGDNVFVMCGFFNDHILVSNYGYEWESIALPSVMSLVSVTYNKSVNKFYMIDTDLTTMVEYDPSTKNINTISLIPIYPAGNDLVVKKIMSWGHRVYINFTFSGVEYTYGTTNTIDQTPLRPDLSESKFTLNYNDDIGLCNCNLKDVIEIGDEVFAIFDTGIAWDASSELEYDKKLTTGILVYQPKNVHDIEDILANNSGMNTFVFPMDKDVRISATIYLNHIIVAHPTSKGYITTDGNLSVAYEKIQNGRYYGLLVNATHLTSAEGYIHMIQNQVNSFSHYSYIISSDSWYNPTVCESDLVHGKKTYQIKEYGLEHVDSEVDKNNNIDVYSVLYGDIENVSSGAVIHTNQFILITKGAYIYLSDNGIKWTKRNLPKNGDWRDIAYNGTYYMAINFIDTDDSEIWYSKDLYTWTKDTSLNGGFSEIYVVNDAFYLTNNHSALKTEYYSCTVPGQWVTTNCGTVVNTLRMPCCILDPDYTVRPICFNKYGSDVVLYDGYCDKLGYFSRGLFLYKTGTVVNAKSLNTSANENLLNSSNLITKPTCMRKIKDEYGRLFFFFFNIGENAIYMSIVNDMEDEMMHVTKIDLPSVIDNDNEHIVCYHNGKIVIAGRKPMILTIDQEYPDIVESSFVVASGETHRESLPFTPDHVFLFGAKSYNENDKLFSGEIHNDDTVHVDGLGHKSVVFYNNTSDTVRHRSDVGTCIMENCFMFANNTLTDRHINYIAIKENHYK